MTYLAISIGAVLGANARYLVGGWVADPKGSTFPYGTLAINLSGSFLIGLVLTLVTERAFGLWWVRAGQILPVFGNVAGSVEGALIGAYLGLVLARAL